MFEDAAIIIGQYANNPNHRYLSWNLFYHFFNDPNQCRDYDSVHLTAYLASWGMYRGSSALLRYHNYTVHDGAVAIIRQPIYQDLVEANLQTYTDENIQLLFTLINALRNHYDNVDVSPTDTLISKILLGCMACLPAYDFYFVQGLRNVLPNAPRNLALNSFNIFLETINEFPNLNLLDNQDHNYPFFKLVDMYFFQIGAQH